MCESPSLHVYHISRLETSSDLIDLDEVILNESISSVQLITIEILLY